MSDCIRVRKDPENVRRRLLDCAARLFSDQAFAEVSIEKIAAEAGVTKGGLLHHFPSKKDLKAAVFENELLKFTRFIDKALRDDTHHFGRFTRAYVRATITACADMTYALSVSVCAEDELAERWQVWIAENLEVHKESDSAPGLELVRYAADGIWFAGLQKGSHFRLTSHLTEMEKRLIALTYENQPLNG